MHATPAPHRRAASADIADVLAADAVLADDIVGNGPPAPRSFRSPERILLTGATGFIGAFVLRDLLDRTPAEVHCLVRADDPVQAAQRIRWTMAGYRLWDETLAHRIIAVPGDLERPRLGLGSACYEALAEGIDVIHHVGARVNHIEPYEVLKAANVDATEELLRLAACRRTKPLFLASSGSVVEHADTNPPVVTEDSRVPARAVLPRGYIRSKWVAEELLAAAGDRGLPGAVFRLDRVSGHSVTGACGTDDSFWHFIRAMVLLAAAPELEVDEMDLVPVDYVASAMVHLAGIPASGIRAYHLMSRQRVSVAFVLSRLREAGYRLETLPFDLWVERLEQTAGRLAATGDRSLVPALLLSPAYRGCNTPFRWGTTRTRTDLDGSGIDCPPIESEIVDRYISYFVGSRFFPTVRKQRTVVL